jgi:predicted TIM-barrel fold metal-dependent hydrolase
MPAYDGPRIDSDIHHRWVSQADLLPYLPTHLRDLVQLSGREPYPLTPPYLTVPHTNGLNKRLDAFSPEGAPPGSDYDTLRRQLLEGMKIDRGVLSYDITMVAALRNPYLAVDAVRAVNDWSLERWIARDERLYGAILVPSGLPEEAAKEIRRHADNPRMVEVILVNNTLGKPFGHPVYAPIHAAAAAAGRPIAIHVAGDGWGFSQVAAGGIPATRLEFHTCIPQPMVHHLVSFITHGVFERHPSLRLLIVEAGVSWLPWLLWALDAHEKLLRLESVWIKRPPSEYVRRHVRLTTQPLEISPRKEQLIDLFRAVGGVEDLLCFATDYPHWDGDDPAYIASRLPASWLPKVFYGNAMDLYGWNSDAAPSPQPVPRPATA